MVRATALPHMLHALCNGAEPGGRYFPDNRIRALSPCALFGLADFETKCGLKLVESSAFGGSVVCVFKEPWTRK